MGYSVRLADRNDLPRILDIYEIARNFMAKNGNPTQWAGGYPAESLLEGDILAGNLYVVTDDQQIAGVFCFVLGEDPTYKIIEDGSWRSNSPYGTIHRIASDGHGVFAAALTFCKGKIDHIRIDTHHNNMPMQHLIEKHGFSHRGIIYVADGTPRIAFDMV